jgi:hypothetical protein
VIYEIHDDRPLILVVRIAHRNDVYRNELPSPPRIWNREPASIAPDFAQRNVEIVAEVGFIVVVPNAHGWRVCSRAGVLDFFVVNLDRKKGAHAPDAGLPWSNAWADLASVPTSGVQHGGIRIIPDSKRSIELRIAKRVTVAGNR